MCKLKIFCFNDEWPIQSAYKNIFKNQFFIHFIEPFSQKKVQSTSASTGTNFDCAIEFGEYINEKKT